MYDDTIEQYGIFRDSWFSTNLIFANTAILFAIFALYMFNARFPVDFIIQYNTKAFVFLYQFHTDIIYHFLYWIQYCFLFIYFFFFISFIEAETEIICQR